MDHVDTPLKTIKNIQDYDKERKNNPNKFRIRRNELCPCGSGKKYKKCCKN